MRILEQLLTGVEYQVLQGNPGQEITGIAYDSRQVEEGNVFVCIPGFKTMVTIMQPMPRKEGPGPLGGKGS